MYAWHHRQRILERLKIRSCYWLCLHEIIVSTRVGAPAASTLVDFWISSGWRKPSIYDCQVRSRDTCVGAYARRWCAMSSSCMGVSLKTPNLDKPYTRHSTEAKNVRRIREVLRTDISSDTDLADLSRCCLPLPFSSIYLIRKVDTRGSRRGI